MPLLPELGFVFALVLQICRTAGAFGNGAAVSRPGALKNSHRFAPRFVRGMSVNGMIWFEIIPLTKHSPDEPEGTGINGRGMELQMFSFLCRSFLCLNTQSLVLFSPRFYNYAAPTVLRYFRIPMRFQHSSQRRVGV